MWFWCSGLHCRTRAKINLKKRHEAKKKVFLFFQKKILFHQVLKKLTIDFFLIISFFSKRHQFRILPH